MYISVYTAQQSTHINTHETRHTRTDVNTKSEPDSLSSEMAVGVSVGDGFPSSVEVANCSTALLVHEPRSVRDGGGWKYGIAQT